jgi:hypothetical protein
MSVKMNGHSQTGMSFINYDPFLDTIHNDVMHTSVKPLIRVNSSQIGYPLIREIHRTELSPNQSSTYLAVFPVVNDLLHVSKTTSETEVNAQLSGGVGFVGNFGEKWHLQGTFTGGYMIHNDLATAQRGLLRDSYVSNPTANYYGEFTPLFRVGFTPNRYFNIQAGIDRHFIGEGMRSVLLGDYGAPFPFVQLRTALWRFEFVNIFQFLRENEAGQWTPKMMSSHMLNYRVNKRLQIGVFESVIFEPRDTMLKRGFEWEYLNPFLFYRPTEYSIGSQDKIVIGAHFSLDLKHVMVYGQFALDDFVLNELRERTRWWANKYAGQIGFKGKLKRKQLLMTYLSELNFARPFTFAHLSQRTSYSHMGMPLGHPMGANFVESFSRIRASFRQGFYLQLDVMFAQQGGGDSNADYGFGEDVLRPYTERPFEYGYFIGGHGKINRLRISAEVGYTLSQRNRLIVFARPIFEKHSGSTQQSYFMFMGGIRTDLWNNRQLTF